MKKTHFKKTMLLLMSLMIWQSADAQLAVGDEFADGDINYQVIADGEVKTTHLKGGYTGTTLTIPATVEHDGYTYKVTTIGTDLVWGTNEYIQTINLPEGLTTLEEAALQQMFALKGVTLPSTVTSLGFASFYNMYNLQYIDLSKTNIVFPKTLLENNPYYTEGSPFWCVSEGTIIFLSKNQGKIEKPNFLYQEKDSFKVSNFVLDEYKGYYSPYDFRAEKVTFDREFTAGDGLCTVYLPFKLSAENNGTFYECIGINADKTAALVQEVSYTTPGSAYLFKPKSEGMKLTIAENIEVRNSLTTQDIKYLVGRYQQLDFTDDNKANCYGYAGQDEYDEDYKNKLFSLGEFVKFGEGATILPFRAYLYAPQAPQAKKLGIQVVNDETTGISLINNEEVGSGNSSAAYNLAGQKVSNGYKGLIIQNGKKVLNF